MESRKLCKAKRARKIRGDEELGVAEMEGLPPQSTRD